MKIVREVTKWESNTPNHIYALNDAGKLIGYQNVLTGSWTTFIKPLMFDQGRRKFEKLPDSYPVPQKLHEEKPTGIVVIGSKGDKYIVEDGKCTCTGFKFRGTCKHLKEAV